MDITKNNERSRMVYLIQNARTRDLKIGIAFVPTERLLQLQTGNSDPLLLLGTISGGAVREHWLHHKFRHSRLRGEWFSFSPRILAEFDLSVDPDVPD